MQSPRRRVLLQFAETFPIPRLPEVRPDPVTSHLMKIMDFKEVDAKLANIRNHLETYQCQLDPTACVKFDIGPPGVFKGSGIEKLVLDL
ncbi:hypothetical protein C0J50_8993 [Silurus asotus]|uniref:Uncharacterized protein n=1 Tax=Silurus asotus TaxID=30991 RepID=A0AAD5ADM3_SILAS|nr:hypothetical protein C0J50_8993 [Silurus asotus]